MLFFSSLFLLLIGMFRQLWIHVCYKFRIHLQCSSGTKRFFSNPFKISNPWWKKKIYMINVQQKKTLHCTAKTDKKEEKKYKNERERRCIKCIAQLSTSFIKTLNIAFLATLQLARMIRRWTLPCNRSPCALLTIKMGCWELPLE